MFCIFLNFTKAFAIRFNKEDLKAVLLEEYEANNKPMSKISFMELVSRVEIELSKNQKFKLVSTSSLA